jgi:hypothetical protein
VWRKRLLTVAAIVVAALIGILVANQFVDRSGAQSARAPRNDAAVSPSVVNAPLPTPQPSFSAPPVTTTTTTEAPPAPLSGTPTAAGMVATLHTYTSLLPAHVAQAFALLTPQEQARNGGPAAYAKTWGAVKDVKLGGSAPHGQGAMVARIKVTPDHGKATDDLYSFSFVEVNGTVLIDKVAVVSRSRHQ